MDNEIPKTFNDENVQFTSRMFSEIVKEEPGKSVVMSAYSVLTPLAQLALASEGASHDELLRAIGMPNDNVTKSVFSESYSKLQTIKGVEIKSASKIYISQRYEVNDDFEVLLRDVFHSEIKSINFDSQEKAAKEINVWVENQTNSKIRDLVGSSTITANTRAILVNAIYFKGRWKNPFISIPNYTIDFHVTGQKKIQVPGISVSQNFNYRLDDELEAQILEMFYTGEEASMVIVLPNEIDGITKLQEKFEDSSLLQKALNNLPSTRVRVTIPKFKIETTIDLKKVLQKMDVRKLFTGEAHLDRLIKGRSDLYISGAIQKAFIEVNEEGAEAGAANKFGMYTTTAFVRPPARFLANHPFLFYLKAGNTILFSGVHYG